MMSSRLLLLLDSRSPAGAHAHSSAMEAAVSTGMVRNVADVGDFCRGRLATGGLVAAAFAAAAAEAWRERRNDMDWGLFDAHLSARMPSPASRLASRQLGRGLGRLVRACEPDLDFTPLWSQTPAPGPHHAAVLGASCMSFGGSMHLAARAAALAACAGPASAAVRLLGLDPYGIQQMLHLLSVEIDETAERGVSAAESAEDLADLPAASAPALEMLAEVQAQSEVRLFAS